MKGLISFLLITSIMSACGNNNVDEPGEEEKTAQPVYSWQAFINDSSGRLEMKKVGDTGPDTLSTAAVISFLNTSYTHVQLVQVKTSSDTIYLKIPDALYLTQQMGSTGPTIYLAQVIYNLTEIPGINYVNLDFDEGDHASPGTFNRKSFKDE